MFPHVGQKEDIWDGKERGWGRAEEKEEGKGVLIYE
jgi:hypothetical protein